MSVGFISGRHAPNTVYPGLAKAEFFQTDAAINTGNSGGPMFNMAGEVVGVVSHMISKSGGSEGLGFVVTSNNARDMLLTRRGVWTGLKAFLVDGDLAALLNVPQPAGLLVEQVAHDSLAEKMGLKPGHFSISIERRTVILGGDVILSALGVTISDPDSIEQIRQRLSAAKSGQPLRVRVLRAGRVLDLNMPMP